MTWPFQFFSLKRKASYTIFIDETIEKIQGAQNLGLTSIHCKNRDLTDVLAQLVKILKQ